MVYVIQLASRIRTERPDPTRKLSANLYDIYHCCVQWNVLILLASCQQTCMTYTIAVYSETYWSYSQDVSKPVWHIPLLCTVKNSWWWTEELSVPSWWCSQAVWHIPLLHVQWKIPDDGQKNCPKHVEFCITNFNILLIVHLDIFIY